MSKTIKCPLCKTGYLREVRLADNEEVDFNKPLREHTHQGICDNCGRKVKYSIKIIEKESN